MELEISRVIENMSRDERVFPRRLLKFPVWVRMIVRFHSLWIKMSDKRLQPNSQIKLEGGWRELASETEDALNQLNQTYSKGLSSHQTE